MLSPFIQKLLFVNKFEIINGKIDVLGERYIMLDASNLLALQELDTTKIYDLIKDTSKGNMKNIVEHAKVYESIKDVSLKNLADIRNMIEKNDEGAIATIQHLFDIYGLGKMEITNLDNKNKEVVIRIKDSTMALEKLKKGKSKNSTCTLTAGVLAGIFSFLFKKDVNCVEKDCLAKGNDFCIFLVK